ncbi:autotransporter family protein [Vogesella indigofera]|uniref:autotransporter family protein n=1 Tax=Vogesella indigofera TaxID=45465 RepID=UPI00234F8666|nr:autotransporter outer membrane beta-barrel domain-containing protein [Vogesella indigofera]MDC7699402.1 autotransporter outer membrane beta-barrel domain-containing protein [Vogesella indigofera]
MKLKKIALVCAIALPLQAQAANVLIYDYQAAGDEAAGLASVQTTQGNTPTTIDISGNYATYTPTGLASYSQVWDLGANKGITADQQTAYTSYLNGGGTLFLMGENAGYGATRNTAISTFIASLGGGTLGTVTQTSFTATTINQAFQVDNATSTLTLPASGIFPSAGTGTCITADCSAVAWAVGTLANAPTGTVISVLDVNFLQTAFLDNNSYPGLSDFVKNLIAYLAQQGEIANGGGVRVLVASTNANNNPALGAAAVIDANANLLALFTNANLSGDQQISAAASQTLPLLTGGSMAAAGNALSGINKVIQARIESNRGLSSGDGFFGDKYVWVKPFGSWADQDDQNGVSGFESTTTGVAFGVDSAVNDKLRLGTAMAYAKADVDSNSNVAKQSADVDVFQLVGYGSYSLGNNSEVNFQVDVGQNSNKGRRSIAFTNSTATSEYTSYTAHAGAGLGRTYQLSATTSITPSIRADYTWIKDKAYQESGAGLLNLNVGSRDSEELVLGLDGKISHQLSDNTSLSANLGVGYDTMAKRSSITATFAGAPGAAFTTYGLDAEPWSARAGVGLTHTTANGTEITLRYDAEHREAFLNQTASLKARWAF